MAGFVVGAAVIKGCGLHVMRALVGLEAALGAALTMLVTGIELTELRLGLLTGPLLAGAIRELAAALLLRPEMVELLLVAVDCELQPVVARATDATASAERCHH